MKLMTQDALASGLAFVNAELEKRDPKLKEPLTSTTWTRDIVAKTGGGWVEFSSEYFVDYATTGANSDGISGGATTAIPVIQANISKDQYQVFTWQNIVKVPFVNQAKLANIGKSLDQIYDNGLRLNYQKTLDENVYVGFQKYGTAGLVNNPNVTSELAAATGTGNTTTWATKTADQILADINSAIETVWAACEYDLRGIPNQIGLPPAAFAYIISQKVSEAGNVSILNYLLENNLSRANGVDLVIVPMRQLMGKGTGNTNRMVVYRNEEDMISFDIPVVLNRAMTSPDVAHMSYLSGYVGQMSQVKFSYPQSMTYVDGI